MPPVFTAMLQALSFICGHLQCDLIRGIKDVMYDMHSFASLLYSIQCWQTHSTGCL